MLTLLLVGLNVAVSLWGWANPYKMDRFLFSPWHVRYKGEYFRVLAAPFFHQDYMHLFFNMFTLFFCGPSLENLVNFADPGKGSLFLLLLYVSGLVFSMTGTFLRYQNDSRYRSLGASGAVSAVLMAAIWFDPTQTVYLFFIPMPGFLFAAIYLMMTAYMSRNDISGHINHDAHFYGSVWGIAFAALWFPQSVPAFFESLIRFQLFS